VRHGTAHFGTMNRSAVLTEDAVRRVRARVAVGHTRTAVARELGVSLSTISRVCSRSLWKHVTDPPEHSGLLRAANVRIRVEGTPAEIDTKPEGA